MDAGRRSPSRGAAVVPRVNPPRAPWIHLFSPHLSRRVLSTQRLRLHPTRPVRSSRQTPPVPWRTQVRPLHTHRGPSSSFVSKGCFGHAVHVPPHRAGGLREPESFSADASAAALLPLPRSLPLLPARAARGLRAGARVRRGAVSHRSLQPAVCYCVHALSRDGGCTFSVFYLFQDCSTKQGKTEQNKSL